MSKFEGKDGTKPSTQARRYVYRILAITLEADLMNGSGFIFEDDEDDELDEFDRRRVESAVKKVIAEMRRKAER